MTYWKPDRIWSGEPCAILASGPSMNQKVADAVRQFRTIAVNNTFRLASWADMLYSADENWWNSPRNKDAADFKGYRVSVTARGAGLPLDENVLILKGTGVEGYDPELGHVRTGNNSGYQALHLAAQLGCSPILLCGFDMRSIKNRQHWHDKHEYPMRDHGDGIYPEWIKSFNNLAPLLEAIGINVINVTPDSALKCFQKMTLEDALESLLHVAVCERLS